MKAFTLILRILGVFFTVYYLGMFVALLFGYGPSTLEIACLYIIAALFFVKVAMGE